nr:uncharacterized protein LOC121469276 [Taeniopygia guttata]
MPEKQEANAHGQPREGQPLLYRRRHQVTPRQPQAAPQVTWTTITAIPGGRPTLSLRPIRSRSPTWSCTRRGSQYGGHSVPRSSVTGPQRLSVLHLPPLHGPPLTLAPPHHLSGQSSRAATDCVKLPPLPAAAASGSSPRGTARAVGAAWDSVKLPPLPAAPAAAAASGSSPGGTARAAGPTARGQPEHVPSLPWGTLAAGRAQGRRVLESRTGGLWNGSVARQGHCLPSVTPARGMPLCTGMRPAWKPVRHSVCENSQPCATSAKELEKKQQEEELPEAQAADEWDQDLQTLLFALLEENEEGAEACALAGDPWDEGHSKLFLTSEPEETSGFSASPCLEGPVRRWDLVSQLSPLHFMSSSG